LVPADGPLFLDATKKVKDNNEITVPENEDRKLRK
jgi:hypothetical protein